MDGVVPPGAAARCRLDHRASGACGAQDCQAAITFAACDHGQCKEKSTGLGAGRVRKVNEVTTPKFPPPPPRHAQNRSLLRAGSAVAVSTAPFAVTICNDSRLSQVSPCARAVTPMPP